MQTDARVLAGGNNSGSKLRTHLNNAAVALISTILSYLVIEAVFFRLVFPMLNPSVRPQLPETPGVLAQTTKAGYVPRDYVAILGDSVAEGLGDAVLAAGENQARAFHAAHVIHRMTGRDAVTFGRGGASSAEGFVREPARILEGSRCFIFPRIEDPGRIFAYFYEGNDIQDNLAFLNRVSQKYGRSDNGAIDAYLADYARFPAWQCHLYLFDIAARMAKFFYKYYYLGVDPYRVEYQHGGSGILLGKETIDAPAPLDGPALEIDAAGIGTAMTVFDRSLSWLKGRFAHVPITVVYVPSALSVYHLTGSAYRYSIEPREEGRSGWASPAQVAAQSDRLCNLVQASSASRGVGFFDARPGLRAAATTRLLHGPVDWVHFNAEGYQVFGALLAGRTDPAAVDNCSGSAQSMTRAARP
jgi:hypothetical protein